jgi:RNA polymerase sigma factor (sigma-70 family)
VAREDEVERLYREQSGPLWRSIVAATGSREVADDAVAEAFTLALEALPSIREPPRWLWRVAFRIAWRDVRRRRREAGAMIEDPYEDRHADPGVMVALRRISPSQRAALVLRYYADLPVKEVAAAMSTTSAAVRVHIMRGRRRLQQLLEEDDE